MKLKDITKSVSVIILFVAVATLVQGNAPSLDMFRDPAWLQILVVIIAAAYDLATGHLRTGARRYLGTASNAQRLDQHDNRLTEIEDRQYLLSVVAADGSRAVNQIIDHFEGSEEEEIDRLIRMDYERIFQLLFDENAAPGDFSSRMGETTADADSE